MTDEKRDEDDPYYINRVINDALKRGREEERKRIWKELFPPPYDEPSEFDIYPEVSKNDVKRIIFGEKE